MTLLSRRGLQAAFGLGVAASAIMAIRIFELQETFFPRKQSLIALCFCGGAAAGLLSQVIYQLLSSSGSRLYRFLIGWAVGLTGFPGTVYLLFALVAQLHPVRVEWDSAGESLLIRLLGPFIDALGMFVTTGAKYMLPWPCFAVALANGGWMLVLRPPAPRATGTDQRG